jgi:aspartyl-tRNA(Asn)/glutamyl-tRNA(Gln) amidotransferase subunit A
MSLAGLTIARARARLDAGDLTSRALTEACLAALDGAAALNAVCHRTDDRALEMADAADRRLAAGERTPMLGIPVGVKDLFCTEGVETRAASRILEGFRPRYESTVTARLWEQGAVLAAKLSMDEFAMGSSTETACYGPCISPWRRKGDTAPITPGGSSGGSSAAVAAGLVPCALGTDTGGSIRQPAAVTGIVGMKPTYGRCSRWGIVAFASSLDQAGPLTRTVHDAAILLGAMSGHDPKDSTSADREVPDFAAMAGQDVSGRRIGIPAEYREGLSEETDRLWQQGIAMLRDAGCEIVEISLPHTKYALPAYYIIAPAEASSNLARYDGVRYGRRARLNQCDGIVEMYEKTRAEGFGREVKRRVLIGTYVLSAGYYDAYYLRAQKVRRLILRDFEQAWETCDAILTPSTPGPGFGLGEVSDPIQMYLNDIYTVTVNLAGLPGISVPVGLAGNGLPLGLQLIGRPWEEGELLALAGALEARAGFDARPERWW